MQTSNVLAPAKAGPRRRRGRPPGDVVVARLTRRDLEITLKTIWPDECYYRLPAERGGAERAAEEFDLAATHYFALLLLLERRECDQDLVAEIRWLHETCAALRYYKSLEAINPERARERWQAKAVRA